MENVNLQQALEGYMGEGAQFRGEQKAAITAIMQGKSRILIYCHGHRNGQEFVVHVARVLCSRRHQHRRSPIAVIADGFERAM
jgi:hypothetical protein